MFCKIFWDSNKHLSRWKEIFDWEAKSALHSSIMFKFPPYDKINLIFIFNAAIFLVWIGNETLEVFGMKIVALVALVALDNIY